MARLVWTRLDELKTLDRVGLAQEKAVKWGHVVLLKGAYTVVAAPDGRATILPFANSILATAGSGDVLAGLIVGLLAQNMDPYDAAVLGGFLHGAAGELYHGHMGMLASEITDLILQVIEQISE